MAKDKPTFHALTLKGSGLLRVLKSDIHVCPAFDPDRMPPEQWPKLHQFVGIWDTGATGTVVTQRVVDACGLKPVTMMKVQGAYGGLADREAYSVNLRLPQGVGIREITAVWGDLAGADVLIGMDVIALGDFAITNQNGQTVFSFRIPSLHTIDYVKQAEHHREQQQAEMAKRQRVSGPQVNPALRRK